MIKKICKKHFILKINPKCLYSQNNPRHAVTKLQTHTVIKNYVLNVRAEFITMRM